MNYKRIVGVVVFVIGVALIIFAVHSMHRISSAKGTMHTMEGLIPKSQYEEMGSKEMGKEASQYDAEVMGMLIGGIILAVAGCGIAIFYGKGKKKKR
jgi:Protein of unknown function (DUF3185)